MPSREDRQIISDRFELPTERDLDRLTAAIRSEGDQRGFPRRVSDRYQQWIFLFIGWCLKAPPGEVARDRIGGFWAALSDHSGVGTARMCEAMDALGFFFGHLRREARLIFSLGGAGAENRQLAGDEDDSEFAHPNPSLHHAPEENGSPSTETPSNEGLSRYLPGGTLPEEPEARSVIPTQSASQKEDDHNASHEESRDQRPDGSEGVEENTRDRPTTLFNPEGAARPSSPSGTADGSDESTPSAGPTGHAQSGSGAPDESQEQKERSTGEEKQTEEVDRVPIQVPRSVADRLRKAARRLGLPPSVFAARAIEMVCDDAGIERLETPDAESPLERYQTQIDLIGLQGAHPSESDSGPDRGETGTADRNNRCKNAGQVSGSERADSLSQDGGTGQQASSKERVPPHSRVRTHEVSGKPGAEEMAPSPGSLSSRSHWDQSPGGRSVSAND